MESGMKAKEARAEGLLTVGEAAEALGTTPRTLLYYEEEGLVRPRRSDRGTRFYSAFDLRRLEMCLRLARLDIPLRTIRALALTRRDAATGEESGRSLVALLAEIRGHSRARIAILQARVPRPLAHEIEQDMRVLGLTSQSETIREALKLLHERAREIAMAQDYDQFYGGDAAPLPDLTAELHENA